MKGFDAAQRAYDNAQPPDEYGHDCPICGCEVADDDDGWKCTKEDCGWFIYPDYPDPQEG